LAVASVKKQFVFGEKKKGPEKKNIGTLSASGKGGPDSRLDSKYRNGGASTRGGKITKNDRAAVSHWVGKSDQGRGGQNRKRRVKPGKGGDVSGNEAWRSNGGGGGGQGVLLGGDPAGGSSKMLEKVKRRVETETMVLGE